MLLHVRKGKSGENLKPQGNGKEGLVGLEFACNCRKSSCLSSPDKTNGFEKGHALHDSCAGKKLFSKSGAVTASNCYLCHISEVLALPI